MKDQILLCEQKMKKCIDNLGTELSNIRAGRANPAILNKINVDYYGTLTPINQMAAIAVPDARSLTIQPWDVSTLSLIEKAINASDLGINPSNDGKVIRLNFPQLTEERRKNMVKDIHVMGEKAKVSIRNLRRETNDKLKQLKKDSQITEDDLKASEKQTQTLTDKLCKEVDLIIQTKEKEILSL